MQYTIRPERKKNLRSLDAQFADFLMAINAGIEELGGQVLPKLNWSAPKVQPTPDAGHVVSIPLLALTNWNVTPPITSPACQRLLRYCLPLVLHPVCWLTCSNVQVL